MKTKTIEKDKDSLVKNTLLSSNEALVVKSDFLNYEKGQLIIEKQKIEEILSSAFSSSVNKILLG